MTNSVDPDQLASSLFAKIGHVVFSKRRVNYVPVCSMSDRSICSRLQCLHFIDNARIKSETV